MGSFGIMPEFALILVHIVISNFMLGFYGTGATLLIISLVE